MKSTISKEEIIEEILTLKREKNAVILAHNYQIGDVQDIADFVGDSLGLSIKAKDTDASVIVFCGVHFMAETASILNPDKKVLLPDLEAGCSLADSITVEELREWKRRYPSAVVVSYVNTTAEIKAESDYCCTSSNAVKVIQSIPEDKEILFLPDMFLGSYVARVTGRKIRVWAGECHVHANIRPEDIEKVREKHPSADFLIHPECGCTTSCYYYVESKDISSNNTYFLSTEGMINFVKNSPKNEFVVATEVGVLHRMKKYKPNASFYPVSEEMVCEYMKKITLEKVLESLRHEIYEVKVPEEIRQKALIPIQRMLEIV
ncbi:MAG: quinolinate synthase NadA [Spirochaetia bacterium]|nr:quinolinate synthase NadA [Spirochaetota bacterium]MCX8097286.1 quinolinate synthase NadA [Spirochaetota bacterium]MDW8112575.1 quinolinate synthase NadA [Spirochaetia bacterium]